MKKINVFLAQLSLSASLSVPMITPVHAEQGPAQAMPAGAYELPVSQKASLQNALNQYKIVRLQKGDYRTGGPASIQMSSGQQLYGLAGTAIPKVVVSGGTTGAVLSSVNLPRLEFPPSSLVTKNNLFQRIRGYINVNGATLDSNLFLDFSDSQLIVDNRNSGYLRNNRFIRFMVHDAAPSISIKGDAGRKSANNTWLWTNIMTPHGQGVYLDNQNDAAFVGVDAESWNWNGTYSGAMFTTGAMGALRVLQANGGQYVQDAYKTGIFDIAADQFQLYGWDSGSSGGPVLTYRNPNLRSALINVAQRSTADYVSSASRLKAFEGGRNSAVFNGAAIGGALPVSQQDILRKVLMSSNRVGQPWERPTLSAIPNPAGDYWNTNLSSKPDSTGYIQNLVNNQGIARLPAGVYYISSPIKLKRGQGIVGAGDSNTAIVAKSPNIDMIIGDEHLMNRYSLTNFVLADLTLQGGKNGIHHEPNGSGPGAQYNLVYLSHVTFRDMAEAGIFIDRIFSWDNNFIDHVNFYRCGAGVKQRVDPNYTGGDAPGMSYLDKNVFYATQFVQNGRGLDLQARRQNNLNAWVNSSFRDNGLYAADMVNAAVTVFANTDFINNGGNPSVRNNQSVAFASCKFQADARGASMIPSNANVEGSTFARGTSTTATILPAASRGFFYNSSSANMPMGGLNSGMVVNSSFAANPALSQQAVLVQNGQGYGFVLGASSPVPQLLFGSVIP